MADDYTIRTELGEITIPDYAIETIVPAAVKTYLDEDKVFFDRRRGWGKPLRQAKNDELSGVEIRTDEEGTHFEVPVIIRFGTSIKAVSDALINGIRKGFKQLTGEEPASIRILVTGTLSKQLIKREIEVEWRRES